MTARHRDLVARHRDLVATCATIRGNAARACQTSYFFLSHRSGSWVRELATARGPQKGLHWFVTLGHSPSRLPSSRFLSGKVFLMASDAAKKLPLLCVRIETHRHPLTHNTKGRRRGKGQQAPKHKDTRTNTHTHTHTAKKYTRNGYFFQEYHGLLPKRDVVQSSSSHWSEAYLSTAVPGKKCWQVV